MSSQKLIRCVVVLSMVVFAGVTIAAPPLIKVDEPGAPLDIVSSYRAPELSDVPEDDVKDVGQRLTSQLEVVTITVTYEPM